MEKDEEMNKGTSEIETNRQDDQQVDAGVDEEEMEDKEDTVENMKEC